MKNSITSRRRFLIATIAASGAIASGLNLALIRDASAWADAVDDDGAIGAKILARMVRLYYPHDNVAGEVYAQTVNSILSAAATDSTLRNLLDAAFTALDGAGDIDFTELDAESQLAAMTQVQDEPFFTAVKFQVLARFYAHPEVWKAINYPGSSVEFGGYVDRGFNDIDWLPGDGR
ncbi:MAG: hypothetical protein HQ492_02310 [Woeseiaceae bacterium]|nr:hypothetical protein [Woeseiaceae bacterium]